MTAGTIKTQLTTSINSYLTAHGLDDASVLTDSQNVALTDQLAGVLETVNPNHGYPPTTK